MLVCPYVRVKFHVFMFDKSYQMNIMYLMITMCTIK